MRDVQVAKIIPNLSGLARHTVGIKLLYQNRTLFKLQHFKKRLKGFYLDHEKLFQLCQQRQREVCAELSELFDEIIEKHNLMNRETQHSET